MGLDDFKEKDVDIVPVQELQRDDPPSDYDSWSEYEPQPDDWDEDVIWAIGECTDEGLDGDEVFVIAINDNRSSVLKSTNFVELLEYQ